MRQLSSLSCLRAFTKRILSALGASHNPHRTRYGAALLLLLVLAAALAFFFYWRALELDMIIVNGLVYDGTSQQPGVANIGIDSGRVVRIDRWALAIPRAKMRIDAGGRVVAPGFVDVHTHVEANLPRSAVFRPENFLVQGVTTIVTGNCGRSTTDVRAMFAALEKHGTLINVATLIGHNSVRRTIMGQVARVPSTDEMKRMEQLVSAAMDDGALGLSTGLAYVPGKFAKRDEVISLLRVAANYGGVYATHIRNEASRGMEALTEAIEIGRAAGTTTQISHLKCSGRAQWNTMKTRLDLLQHAREGGLRVFYDAYPYTRSSTTTDILLPEWALADSRALLRKTDPQGTVRERLRQDILRRLQSDGWTDLRHVRIVAGRPEWIGKTLAEVPAPASTLDEQVENLIALSIRGGAQAIFEDMTESDVSAVLSDPYCMFGSDSAVRDPEGDYRPHPRGSGCFPRLLHRYVGASAKLSMGGVLRRASALPAAVFGLSGRGAIALGSWADIVIFDPSRIEDRSDYDQPFAAPTGIDYVIVNGSVVVDHGQVIDKARPGMIVRRARGELARGW